MTESIDVKCSYCEKHYIETDPDFIEYQKKKPNDGCCVKCFEEFLSSTTIYKIKFKE